ncbi:MAG: BON domain-containing protein [Planctomycetaceae bacterium]|nr:BON domain-containing protein [Planctomycetaceae bacterium]
MRLLIVPLLFVGLLVQAPTSALGNPNQQAAEKIADVIGEQFPDADIAVAYQAGQVWLKGEAATQNQREKIVEQVFSVPGINVSEVKDDIQVANASAPAPVRAPVAPPQATRLGNSATNAPIPMPNASNQNNQRMIAAAPANARQVTQTQQRAVPPPQTWTGAMLAPAPQQHAQAAYGQSPGQQPMPMTANPYAQTSSYVHYSQGAQHQPPAYYGPPAQAAHHPEAYGPQGPLPGNYNQPYLPDYAWPSYAAYPNSAQISYPRNYSPKAWPYIGPFYPYPQVPQGWRKVTLEHNNGWWWLDFDDGTPSGPFSGLFRQPARYTY